MSSEPEENVGTVAATPTLTPDASTGTGSQAVPIDVEKAGGGVVGELQATEEGKGDDGKGKASEAVKVEGKKEGRKQMASRSDMWEHFAKIKHENVVVKGKCNYCKTDIAAHPAHNGTSALRQHFRSCKRNPHKNSADGKQGVLQVGPAICTCTATLLLIQYVLLLSSCCGVACLLGCFKASTYFLFSCLKFGCGLTT